MQVRTACLGVKSYMTCVKQGANRGMTISLQHGEAVLRYMETARRTDDRPPKGQSS